MQLLDLVDHVLGIAHAVVAPELPLRAERAGEGAAAREVGDGDAGAQGDVGVLVPVEHVPVGLDRGHVLDRVGGFSRDDLFAFAEGETLDCAGVRRPAPLGNGCEQRDRDFLALAAHDHVDMRGLGEDLRIHEGRMDPAQHPHGARDCERGDLEHALGGVDRGGDRGGADDIGLKHTHPLGQRLVGEPLGHGVDEGDVVEACAAQRPGQIGDPGRWPCPSNLGPAGAVVGMNEQNAHGPTPPSGWPKVGEMAALRFASDQMLKLTPSPRVPRGRSREASRHGGGRSWSATIPPASPARRGRVRHIAPRCRYPRRVPPDARWDRRSRST